MDLSPGQLDMLHEGYDQLTAPVGADGRPEVQHSKRKRPGT